MAPWNLTTVLVFLLLSFGEVLPSSSEESSRTVGLDGATTLLAESENVVGHSFVDANATETNQRTAADNTTMPPILQQQEGEEEEVLSSPNSLLFTGVPAEAMDDPDIALGSDLGVVQSLDAGHMEAIYRNIREARHYMQEVVQKEPKYEKVRGTCQNAHTDCTYWAVQGECDNNPGLSSLCGWGPSNVNSFYLTFAGFFCCIIAQDT